VLLQLSTLIKGETLETLTLIKETWYSESLNRVKHHAFVDKDGLRSMVPTSMVLAITEIATAHTNPVSTRHTFLPDCSTARVTGLVIRATVLAASSRPKWCLRTFFAWSRRRRACCRRLCACDCASGFLCGCNSTSLSRCDYARSSSRRAVAWDSCDIRCQRQQDDEGKPHFVGYCTDGCDVY